MTDREIDALVAEKVMGCYIKYYENAFPPHQQVPECGCHPRQHGDVLNLPAYSTDIAAAWEVVEMVGRQHFELIHWWDDDRWQCNIGGDGSRKPYTMPQYDWQETAPRAICLAALKAVGVEVPA